MSTTPTDYKSDRRKAAEAAINFIKKRCGEGSIMLLGQTPTEKVSVVSTGSIALDHALGVGGLPKGRVIEIFGPESSGKTTLVLNVIAQTQKYGGICAFIDTEHTFDPSYAKLLGVKNDELLLSQPDYGEQALDIVETLVRSNGIDLVVVDSVAALTPKSEIEGDMGDAHVGLQARLMSQALRKLNAIMSKHHCTVIFTNQLRSKIGTFGFGNPEVTTGGNALKFYASVRLDIRRIGALKEKEEVVGNQTQVKVIKNKVAPPFRQARFEIVYNEGISQYGEVLDFSVEYGYIEKSGSWYSHEKENIGQGREAVKQYFRDHPDLFQKLRNRIRQKLGLPLVDDRLPCENKASSQEESVLVA